MFTFFNRNRTPTPTPSWLKWALIIFVAYAFINGAQKGPRPESHDVHAAMEKAADNLAPSKLVDVRAITQKLLPETTALVIREGKAGHGPGAICGQEVSIAYTASLQGGGVINDAANQEKPLRFHIGEGKVMPVFDQGLIGMQVGGRRLLTPPMNMAYGAPGFTRDDIAADAKPQFEVELLSLAPQLPDLSQSPYRIFITDTGGSSPVLCGKPVTLHVTLWSVDGKKLFTTHEPGKQPITFTPGKSEVFVGLEQGVIGMLTHGSRTLLVPPAFQRTMSGKSPTFDFPLPKGQAVIVDIESVGGGRLTGDPK